VVVVVHPRPRRISQSELAWYVCRGFLAPLASALQQCVPLMAVTVAACTSQIQILLMLFPMLYHQCLKNLCLLELTSESTID
jgi:hypothetical protein